MSTTRTNSVTNRVCISHRSFRGHRRFMLAGAIAAAALLAAGRPALAQDTQPAQTRPPVPAQPEFGGDQIISRGLDEQGALRLDAGRTAILQAEAAVTEISVGRPEIAGINLLSPTRILVTGLAAGTTQLVLFAGEQSQVIEVTVDADITGLRTQLRELFPDLQIVVLESNDRLVVRGDVPNLETAEQVVQVVAPYGEVLNFLEVSGGQQIMLQVVFAEVARSASSQLGFNFGATNEDGFFASNIGGNAPFGIEEADAGGGLILGAPDPGASVTLFGAGTIGDTAFAAFLAALRDNNLMRVLARPNLLAVSGEPASFLAGGEFPIPVAQAGGTGASTVTIEFREFGVRLQFVAIALGDGRIRLQASPEVSDVDFSNAVQFGGFTVPGLTQRRVDTTVELADGQSLAIAGLLDSRITSNKSVVPILGDLPILGTLFRSVRYQRRETELVVFVTPRLVSALNPSEIPELPGQRWDHASEGELFFLGNIGRPAAETGEQGDGGPLFYGPYGFNRAPEGARE
jgi:pilus assembly protein CpaC